jgi:hypothetical protein
MHQKLKRYSDYLKFEMMQQAILGSISSDRLMMAGTQIAFIRNKGKRDAQDVKTNGNGLYARCTRDGCDDRCVIDCVAQAHPTAASVLRCALLPDDLPY